MTISRALHNTWFTRLQSTPKRAGFQREQHGAVVGQVSQVSQHPRARRRKPCPRRGPMGWTRTRAHISTACTFTGLQPMALWRRRWAGAQRALGGLKPSCARRGWCSIAKAGRCRPMGEAMTSSPARGRQWLPLEGALRRNVVNSSTASIYEKETAATSPPILLCALTVSNRVIDQGSIPSADCRVFWHPRSHHSCAQSRQRALIQTWVPSCKFVYQCSHAVGVVHLPSLLKRPAQCARTDTITQALCRLCIILHASGKQKRNTGTAK